MTDRTSPEHWVCLAGGNALGAFHAGAVTQILNAGLSVQRVAGASIGAIVGALWLGGPRERAASRLQAFWGRGVDRSVLLGLRPSRQLSAVRALLAGRPALFSPTLPGLGAIYPFAPNDDHIHSTVGLRRTLLELIDFDVLNNGQTRFIATALDQKTAEDVVFDTAETRITVDHLMASTALPLIFPPVEIDGRLLVDPGLSANLPVAAAFRDPPRRNTLCWAIDLWPALSDRPPSPDTVARRTQDLLFAAQSRHALESLGAALSPRLEQAGVAAAIHHLGYDGADWEVGAKAFDYSRAALARRREAGTVAMRTAIGTATDPSAPGLALVRHPFAS